MRPSKPAELSSTSVSELVVAKPLACVRMPVLGVFDTTSSLLVARFDRCDGRMSTCRSNRPQEQGNRLRPQASREFDEMPGRPSWTILPGFRLRPGSTPSNNVRWMNTPAGEMSWSIQGECSSPTPWWCETVPWQSMNDCWMARLTAS